jgi:GTPase SAR1 family protein
MSIRSYRIAVCGHIGSGKSTWIERLRTDKFISEYVPTVGVRGDIIRFDTNYGIIFINFLDMGVIEYARLDERYIHEGDKYLIKADARIIIVDGSEKDADTSSYYLWYRSCQRLYRRFQLTKNTQ